MSNILYNIKQLPLSICTRNTSIIQSEEKLIDASIVNDNNIIKLLPVVDESEIYLEQHNVSDGEMWKNHNRQFVDFIKRCSPTKILEIGGGSGNIYKEYRPKIPWTIIDLNPTINTYNNLIVIRKEFLYTDIKEEDTLIASHFFEHISNHEEFLLTLKRKKVKNFIISIPNMLEYMKYNFPSLHFEHPVLVTENYIDFICNKTGWKIVSKKHYKDHSIFYHLEVSDIGICKKYNINYELNILDAFFSHIKRRIIKLRNYKFYMFGAHFPLYYFLSLGLSEDNILGVIDNDTKKQNKRMYGLNIFTYSPLDIPVGSNICIEMGPYTEEIKQNLDQYNII